MVGLSLALLTIIVIIDIVLDFLINPSITIVVQAIPWFPWHALQREVSQAEPAWVAVRVRASIPVQKDSERYDGRIMHDPMDAMRHGHSRGRVSRSWNRN